LTREEAVMTTPIVAGPPGQASVSCCRCPVGSPAPTGLMRSGVPRSRSLRRRQQSDLRHWPVWSGIRGAGPAATAIRPPSAV